MNLTLSEEALGVLTKIARHSSAVLYDTELTAASLEESDAAPLVYKKYLPHVLSGAGPGLGLGLTHLITARGALPQDEQSVLDAVTVWPLAIVQDPNSFAQGVLMRRLPADYYFRLTLRFSGKTELHVRDGQRLLMLPDHAAATGVEYASEEFRVKLLRRLAFALAFLHKRELVFGDLSARNMVYNSPAISRDPAIKLLDCDGIRPVGTRSAFGQQLHTPDWSPPEVLKIESEIQRLYDGQSAASDEHEITIRKLERQRDIQSKKTDVAKFALFVLRVLSIGSTFAGLAVAGPQITRDSTAAEQVLTRWFGSRGASLLRASLRADERPSMRDWFDLLNGQDEEDERTYALPQGWWRERDPATGKLVTRRIDPGGRSVNNAGGD